MEGKKELSLLNVQNRSDFDSYVAMMEDVYRFVLYGMDNYNRQHDYGTGESLSMVEMHTLDMIDMQPGLCVKDVAKLWNRTLGAASKNVNALCKKGFVVKKKLPGNDKNIHLYTTPKGQKLTKLQRQYDRDEIADVVGLMLVRHTEAELKTFHEVIKTGIQIYEKNNQQISDL